jgi:6,7-dimethyl-8-ribityllumazine synthase
MKRKMEKGLPDELELPEMPEGVTQIAGEKNAGGMEFAVVVSRYNGELTEALLRECLGELIRLGADPEDLEVTWVPGAYEIPMVVDMIVRENPAIDAVIALGCVIEGETSHADVITRASAAAMQTIAIENWIPVLDGIVCARTMDQAKARCLPGPGCRGPELARSAVEMAALTWTMMPPSLGDE